MRNRSTCSQPSYEKNAPRKLNLTTPRGARISAKGKRILESKPATDLYISRRLSDRRRGFTEVCVRRIEVRRREVRLVQGVDGLDPKLDLHSFPDPKAL